MGGVEPAWEGGFLLGPAVPSVERAGWPQFPPLESGGDPVSEGEEEVRGPGRPRSPSSSPLPLSQPPLPQPWWSPVPLGTEADPT